MVVTGTAVVAIKKLDSSGIMMDHYVTTMYCLVVTGTMEWMMTFHSVGKFITPTDEAHHFSEG